MKLIQLKNLKNAEQNKKLNKVYRHFLALTADLEDKQLPLSIIDVINEEISTINQFSDTNKALTKLIQHCTKTILKTLEEGLNIVPKHHYQNLWMVYGMSIGILFTVIVTTVGYENTWTSFPMGLSMGLIFGLLAGKNRDDKAKKMNLQLNNYTI